jgi:hypothetical protein
VQQEPAVVLHRGTASARMRSRRVWLIPPSVTTSTRRQENYRAEFDKITTNESVDALLGRMKRRLEKTE